MSQKLVLIDGHSILNRAFYGVPDLSNAKGLHTNAIYGFLNILFKILEEEQPDYLAVAFDVHAPTFRHELYQDYKGTRKQMPEELREQVPVMKELLRAMRIVTVEQAGLEADDILGTLAKKAEREGMEVSLVSGDRDLLQIASEHIMIRIPKTKRGGTEIEDYYPADVERVYGVTPQQFIELKALMGDASDNIPGVPKVGEKTASALMREYGSLEGIYAHLEEISKNSIRESLREHRDLADLSLTLARIRTDCELELDYEAARAEGFYTPEAYAIVKELEFKKILTRFSSDSVQGASRTGCSLHTVETLEECLALLRRAQEEPRIGLEVIREKQTLLGAAWCVGDEAYVYRLAGNGSTDIAEPVQMELFFSEDGTVESGQSSAEKETQREEASSHGEGDPSEEQLAQAIRELSEKTAVAAFDIKPQYAWLSGERTDAYFDILIAAYLLNPLKSDYDVEAIASEYLGLMIPGTREVLGKLSVREAFQGDFERVAEYFGNIACVALHAAPVLEEKLGQSDMEPLMREIEMPLSLVLYDMEREGILVKSEELKRYGEALVSRIQELEKKIHQEAGMEFNIQSPRQLGEVLFDVMKLPGGKKTKTGYSTAADVLEKLAEDAPFVRDVLEYRGLTKLKSTYADGLAEYIGSDGRIHTNFHQTITATGRISSTEPNLQNIPMRTELGRRIRKVFVPREGCVFLDADYSQIELRVLAHMSGDEQLIEAYHSDQDIHRSTAAKVFHVPPEEVTDLMRRNAKAVNFGIVYGISSFGLSQDLSITRKEAAAYIDQYFETYPDVKGFLDGLVESARKSGYVRTLYGRRRPVPELSSSNFMQRSFGERVAMNTPIQGTAADIIKIAMIRVWRALREAGLRSRLILQVHDELLIETYREEEETVRRILEDNMKNAASLAVILEVDLHDGTDWYESK